MRSAVNRGISVRMAVSDALQPSVRDAVGVTLIEERDHLLFEELDEGVRIVLVLCVRIGVRRGDGPAVLTVVGFGPPAIEHAEVQTPVQGDLHAAGAARFQRWTRQVEPQVDARTIRAAIRRS